MFRVSCDDTQQALRQQNPFFPIQQPPRLEELLSVPTQQVLFSANLLLELKKPIQKSLGSWWTTRNIDIHWNNPVTSSHNRIRIVVISSTVCTASHRYNISRIWHLIVHFSQCRGHFCLSVFQRQSSHQIDGEKHEIQFQICPYHNDLLLRASFLLHNMPIQMSLATENSFWPN